MTAALENHFGIPGKAGLATQMGKIAGTLAEDHWNDNQYDTLHTIDGSFLEEYDELNIGYSSGAPTPSALPAYMLSYFSR